MYLSRTTINFHGWALLAEGANLAAPRILCKISSEIGVGLYLRAQIIQDAYIFFSKEIWF
jgi:hypothetical protein